MKQEYENYTSEDKQVWQKLFSRQKENLLDKGCVEYNECLAGLSSVLHENKIPKFEELNEVLLESTGWTITVVPGLIPVDDFFDCLAKKKFCSSTWLRKMSELDYLEEPDMFHDIFGHIPLLLKPKYAQFMEEVGKLGVKYRGNEELIVRLQRLYWFSIEFGLVKDQGTKIYGAGTISSFGETNHIYGDKITVQPFDLLKIFENDFINSEIQNKYYLLENMDQLYNSISDLETTLLNASAS